MNNGEVAIIDSTTIEISELPVKSWTQVSYSSFVLFCRDVNILYTCSSSDAFYGLDLQGECA